ncbi:VOC family protein [Roseivivax sp. CAU 1761]
MIALDHLAVLGETLEEAAAHVEAALGLPMLPGGKHPHYGTHNRLLGLGDGLFLEAIACDPAAPPPERARWFGLDSFRGPARLDKWICRVADLDEALEELPMAGRPVELSRGALRWRMAVPPDGALPWDGLFPALIEWLSPVPPGNVLTPSGWHLKELIVAHPRAMEMAELLRPHLDARRVCFVDEPVPALRAEFGSGDHRRILQ